MPDPEDATDPPGEPDTQAEEDAENSGVGGLTAEKAEALIPKEVG